MVAVVSAKHVTKTYRSEGKAARQKEKHKQEFEYKKEISKKYLFKRIS
jgi:hypothetical protein